MTDHLNRLLDAIPHTMVTVGGRRVPVFRLCGTIGFALGTVAGAALAAAHGRSPWLVLGLGAVAAVTFMALSAVTVDADGRERLVYYHHQLAVLATTTATLVLVGASIPAYLDSVVVGLGVFLVCGRIGCLMVGCCHGRPARRFGITYGHAHVPAGFPAHRAGVRLVPVQALESGWALGCVGLAVAASFGGGPGAGATAYVSAYAAGRFALEYLRGDGARPYLLAVSEAQWSSVALAAAVAGAGAAGLLPTTAAHVALAAALALAAFATLVVGLVHRRSDRVLLTPRHLDEVAWTISHLTAAAAIDGWQTPEATGTVPSVVHVAATSQGLSISSSTLVSPRGAVHHFGLSRPAGLTPETAGDLGRMLSRLHGDAPAAGLPSRGGDVFHLTLVHRFRGE